MSNWLCFTGGRVGGVLVRDVHRDLFPDGAGCDHYHRTDGSFALHLNSATFTALILCFSPLSSGQVFAYSNKLLVLLMFFFFLLTILAICFVSTLPYNLTLLPRFASFG